MGGPGSFQVRFEQGLKKLGWKVGYAGDEADGNLPDVVFVVGGTRQLGWLYKMKRRGVPIIYRLDGIVWLHKRTKRGAKYYLTAEFRNLSSKLIHAYLADVIVYQSRFVQQWWDKEGFTIANNTHVIHNGVQIPEFQVSDTKSKRLVVLEGTIDYSPYAIRLLNELAEKLPGDIRIELYGGFEHAEVKDQLDTRIDYKGYVYREEVYDVFKGSVYLTLDINPACPNTVAEALACGAPVVGFKTGAIGELVDKQCGNVVEYGSDPWSLAYPDVDVLIEAIPKVFDRYIEYSKNARQKAAKEYDQKNMVQKYIDIIDAVLID
jgi:glycosyltransferase involved in cell wall biosynthesis